MKRSLKAVLAVTAFAASFGALAQASAPRPLAQERRAVVAGAAASAAATTSELTPYKGELPVTLKFAKQAGSLEIFKSFPAAGGLVGWVVQDLNSGKNLVVYTSKDGEVLLAGMALDKTGKNLTASYAEQYIPAQDYSVAMAEFAKAATVVVGNPNAKASMTVIFDANCGYCKALHKLIQPAVDAGDLRVTYVPVAILGQDSDVKAAGILASKTPAAAVHATVEGYPESSNDKTLLAKVMSNTMLMKKWGFSGTPGVLYKGTANGQTTVFVANGLPSPMSEMFTRMGIDGHLDTLKDPNLARFTK